MIKKLCFIFVVTLTFDVRARPFEVEKQEIDAYAYGLNYANQISSMYQYVFSVLRENAEDRYDQKILTHVLDFFDGKKDQVDKAVKDQHEFNILYGGCCLLKEFVELSNPQKIDVLGMAELCACLFSPELFALTEDPENAEYGIYRAAYRAQERVARISASYLDAEEKTEALFKKKYPYFRCNPSYVVTSSFLTPQILRGEAAVFSDKAFIYALSKGILLYGLSHQKNDVHGGLYKYPAYLFNHDQAHANDILRCGATSLRPKKYSDQEYQKLRDQVVMLAGCFYDLIEDDRIFDVVEKPKAWTAAFLILHESEIYQATSLYASRRYYINSASTFKLLLNQAKKTLSRRIAVVSYLKPLSLMSQAEAMVSNIRMNDQAQDKWHYSERNISDYAAMMYALYPDQEDELYGTGEAEDRTLMYNAKHVEKLINNLLDWFSIKVSTRLG